MIVLILVLAIACGVLSAWTGAGGHKWWRRIFVPAVTAAAALIVLGNLWMISMMARAAALSLGYGIPDATDEGSAIGKFWYKTMTNDPDVAGILTRATIGLVETITIIAIPIFTGHWILWALAGVIIICNNIWWGAIKTGEGTFTLFGKKLLKEEFYIEAIDTFLILGLVLLCK